MSEDKKDSIIGTGPDGEPVINFTHSPAFNAILTDTAKSLEEAPEELKEALQEIDDLETRDENYEELQFVVEPHDIANSGIPIRTVASKNSHVEVVPGVMVAQHLIDAAVSATTGDSSAVSDKVEELEQAHAQWRRRDAAELRMDLVNSAKLVKEMFDRMRNPAKYDAKFVSYDQMPAPLQRVVNAYIAVSEANKELEEAIKGISALQPIKAA